MQIPKVEFDIYCKLNGTNLIKLNISICENSKISLSVPVKLSEDINKLNSSGEYYNNKCSKTTSDSGTDIILKDRQKEFVEGNKTLCQDDCHFSDYDNITQKANCSCNVKETAASVSDMNINSNKLYEIFNRNKKEVSNLGVTSCNVFSSIENIISNTGFFLLLVILAIFVVIFIIFCTKGYNSLERTIDSVIYKKFKNEHFVNNQMFNNHQIGRKTITKENKIKPKIKQKKSLRQNSKKASNRKIIQKSDSKNTFMNKNHNINRTQSLGRSSKRFSGNLNHINNNKKQETGSKPDTDYELNWLTYKEALRYDKRTKCEYYCSLIRSKQLIIFTFCSFKDYNSGIVKKFMFFLSFALHYTVNALFFDEANLHQIYEDKGKYNFEYQISFTIYSALISTGTLRLMLQILVLTDKDILQVKLQTTKSLAINMKKMKLKYMKIKFAIFFIFNFILLGLFWYYLTSFNAIYQNTQVYLIKNTFISFGFSLFYPFIINLLPMMIRFRSLHCLKKDKEYFYKSSQIIQLI